MTDSLDSEQVIGLFPSPGLPDDEGVRDFARMVRGAGTPGALRGVLSHVPDTTATSAAAGARRHFYSAVVISTGAGSLCASTRASLAMTRSIKRQAPSFDITGFIQPVVMQ